MLNICNNLAYHYRWCGRWQ